MNQERAVRLKCVHIFVYMYVLSNGREDVDWLCTCNTIVVNRYSGLTHNIQHLLILITGSMSQRCLTWLPCKLCANCCNFEKNDEALIWLILLDNPGRSDLIMNSYAENFKVSSCICPLCFAEYRPV